MVSRAQTMDRNEWTQKSRQIKKPNATWNGLKMGSKSWYTFHQMVRYFLSPCIWADRWFLWPTVYGSESMIPVGLTFKRTGTFYPAPCRPELPLLISLTALMKRPHRESLRHQRGRGGQLRPPSMLALPAKAWEWDRLGHPRPVQPSAE